MVLATVDAKALREQKQRNDECVQAAVLSGLRSAAIALAASGSMTWLLQRYSEAFALKFNVSAKASFVVMAPFYVFWMESERAVGRCRLKNDNKHMNLHKLNAGSNSSSSSSSTGGSSSSSTGGGGGT